MTELLALTSALFYGAADFFGGLTARRASTVATVLMSQFVGLVLLVVALPFLPGAAVTPADWIWGVVAGLSGGIGVALLYRALAVGTMTVVAPITAVCAAMIPVLFAFVMGERLRPLTLVGVALAFVAIALVSQPGTREQVAASRSSEKRAFPPGVLLALLSGVIIGLFFLALARTNTAAGMWPLLAARITSVTLFGAIALATGRSIRLNASATATATAGGVLDMVANALYMIAARVGPLSIVITLASLYPAATVILARVVLGERLGFLQTAGIGCALAAVVIIVGTTG